MCVSASQPAPALPSAHWDTAHLAPCLFIFYLSHALHLDLSFYSCELRFHPTHHQVVGITYPVVGWIMVGLKRSSRVGGRNCVLRISCCIKSQLCFISLQGLVARFQLSFFFLSISNLPVDEQRARLAFNKGRGPWNTNTSIDD